MENADPIAHPLLDAPRFLLDWPSWAAWTKPNVDAPRRPLDLRRFLRAASTTQQDTWAPFSYARTYLARNSSPARLPHTVGVGILVAPPIVFVDFDDMLTDDRREPPPWAHEFLRRAAEAGAFTEWSGSGTGGHAFIRTSTAFPALTRNRYTREDQGGLPVGIEIYSHTRFAALTGVQYHPGARPELNEPRFGDKLLLDFIHELGQFGATISTPEPTPITVPRPNDRILSITRSIIESSGPLQRAFADPQGSFAAWAADRAKRNLDDSLSAWRFSLYSEASRHSPISPQPVYELFNPKTEPAHPGIAEWQEFSGYLRKKHRVYSDIQRAHALIAEEHKILALDLGEPPPPTSLPDKKSKPKLPPSEETAASWASMGLVMKEGKNSIAPLACSINYIRCITRHPFFNQWKIERNLLDGTTRVNRQPITDTQATRFLEPLRSILDFNKDPPIEAVRDAIEVVADDNAYDPLREYLESLPKFDPDIDEPLLSKWLESVGAKATGDTERFSRRILIALVARAMKPGIKFDYVPVFEGPQGIRKSTLVELLVSPDYYAVLTGSLQNKDAFLSLRGKWGVELSEMTAFKRSDEETRKAFFSSASDTFRPPYGRAAITIPRRTVLFGTTNDKQYLTDHTGARRYWPILFEGVIDTEWFREHRDRLFAEALYAFQQGEAFHDTMSEIQDPARQQALLDRMVTPAWQMRIIEHLKSLPAPHLGTEDQPGFSGLLTTKYVAELKRTLDLPTTVETMTDAQLASFLRRAGFHSQALSYRQPNRISTKTYGWAHPALLRLTDEQVRAFWSSFPALFKNNQVPPSWSLLQEEHLPRAIAALSTEPSEEE